MRIRAIREGAVEFLAKPFDHHLLLKRSVLHLICEQPRLLQSIAGTCNSLPGHAALTFHNTCRVRGEPEVLRFLGEIMHQSRTLTRIARRSFGVGST
jgi:DNA-binding response OmpR family regulator